MPPGSPAARRAQGRPVRLRQPPTHWSTDALDPAPSPWKLAFEVKVGDVGNYEINAEASADGGLKAKQKLVTDVFGMADVDLVVSERQRVVNVGGTTTFLIRLRNYGTKDATNILLNGSSPRTSSP